MIQPSKTYAVRKLSARGWEWVNAVGQIQHYPECNEGSAWRAIAWRDPDGTPRGILIPVMANAQGNREAK
jgi:hypothetical protein